MSRNRRKCYFLLVRASKFYGGENRELVRVIQVALNITDRICSDDGEVAIKPGANGVPK